MTHRIKTNDGIVTVNMGCAHPDFENRRCTGNCETCKYGEATLTIADFFRLAPEGGWERG